jgi:plastocyanin
MEGPMKIRALIAGGLIGVNMVAGGSVAQAQAGGTVSGQVTFEGTPPARKTIEFGPERQCALDHTHPPQQEDLVITDGAVQWVLVYVKEGLTGDFPAPTEPVVVDQKGCLFLPHVTVARVGQPVEFRNSDPVLHNVRGKSSQAQGFNVAQPIQGMKTTKTLKKPEVGMLLHCDVHYWMDSYLHVLPHPFYAVTGADGTFNLADLPAGTYTIEAWHEKLGTQTQTVTVAEGQAVPLTFTFKAQ